MGYRPIRGKESGKNTMTTSEAIESLRGRGHKVDGPYVRERPGRRDEGRCDVDGVELTCDEVIALAAREEYDASN